jgi:predicted DNA-binding transcriptional regulator AlpA
MLSFIPVPEAARRILLSKPSYYRLAQEKLVPPPVRISPSRSAVVVSELERVITARVEGQNDADIRALVVSLIEERRRAPNEAY